MSSVFVQIIAHWVTRLIVIMNLSALHSVSFDLNKNSAHMAYLWLKLWATQISLHRFFWSKFCKSIFFILKKHCNSVDSYDPHQFRYRYMYVYIETCMFVCMCVCIYACMNVCLHVSKHAKYLNQPGRWTLCPSTRVNLLAPRSCTVINSHRDVWCIGPPYGAVFRLKLEL